MAYASTFKPRQSRYHNTSIRHEFRDYTVEVLKPASPPSHYKDYSKCERFYVKPLDTKDIYYYEALKLESGAVLVGTDVFRLTINDTPSHKVTAFKSIEDVLEKYRIVERKYY